jgi:acetate kinase
LVLNAGSTGLKASLHGATGACLWRDQRRWAQLGLPEGAALRGVAGQGGPAEDPAALVGPPAQALATWLAGMPTPTLVGHRVVHGGERFTAPTRLESTVVAALEGLTPLAPLHNGPALALIHWARLHWPAVPQWACFDTAFHATLPPEARTYAIPAAWRQQGLHRYGFHGLNHQHVAERVAADFGAEGSAGPLRLISCHLGGGCSLCAIHGGRSIATTMGFTPLEGLVMASRSGSVDPGLLLHQLRRGLGLAELEQALQREGGLLGLSELSGSMEVLRAAAAPPPGGQGHGGAALAIAVFRQRLLEGIGAMAACLGGVDVLALSGGIGEHDRDLRSELEAALAWLGPPALVVVGADEEGVIARSCLAVAGGGNRG